VPEGKTPGRPRPQRPPAPPRMAAQIGCIRPRERLEAAVTRSRAPGLVEDVGAGAPGGAVADPAQALEFPATGIPRRFVHRAHAEFRRAVRAERGRRLSPAQRGRLFQILEQRTALRAVFEVPSMFCGAHGRRPSWSKIGL